MNPFSSFLLLCSRMIRPMMASVWTAVKRISHISAIFALGTAIVGVMTFASAGFAGGRNAITAYAETPGQDKPFSQGEEEEETALLTEAKIQFQVTGIGNLKNGQLLLGDTLAKTIHKDKELQQEKKAAVEKNREASRLILEERKQLEAREVARKAEEEARRAAAEMACSDSDYQVLLRIVEAEAGICDMKGRILVANVIMNRVRSREFPNSITDVVYQKNQFSPVSDGRLNRVKVTDTTVEAVNRALAGEDYSQGALYFMNRRRSQSKNVRWFDGQLTYLFHHDRHEFFR